jgi:hypothetical protein
LERRGLDLSGGRARQVLADDNKALIEELAEQRGEVKRRR